MTYPMAIDTFGDEECDAAKRVIDSGRMTMGPEVEAYESEFAAWVGSKYAVAVNSGSSANLLAVEMILRRTTHELLWEPGDEVLVPALAWPTTVWPLVQLGLVPVFCDVDPTTLAISLHSARSVISDKTRGMFLIHVLGRCPNMAAYVQFCEEHKLTLLEDVCESLGAHHNERHAGRFGKLGTFSTYFSHHISTVEGGVVVTDDRQMRDDLVSARSHGWARGRTDADTWASLYPELDPRFLFVSPGYNVRPTEIQAAIGRVQLRKLDSMLDARESLALYVHKVLPGWLALVGSETLSVQARWRKHRSHSWMMLPFIVGAGGLSREAMCRHLESKGVETRPILAGNLLAHPAMSGVRHRCAEDLPNANRAMSCGFMVGCHPIGGYDLIEALRGLR
jgi:CDP-6-deoxy-D-xylo-4-hexulose-3-dehydrase